MRNVKSELIKFKKDRTKLLAILLTGLLVSACSEDTEQPKQLVESAAAPVVEQVEKTVQQAEKMTEATEEAVTSEPMPMEEHSMEKAEPAVEKQIEAVETKDEETQIATSEPQNHTVKAAVTKFLPMVLFINPGDTVTWTNMAGHDTASLDGMIPEGAEAWQSKMGELFSLTFEKEGAYVYKCTPHASLGMLGVIIVGDGEPSNLEQITSHPGNKGMVKRAIRKMTQELDKR